MNNGSWWQKIPWPRSDRRTVALLLVWLLLFTFTGCVVFMNLMFPHAAAPGTEEGVTYLPGTGSPSGSSSEMATGGEGTPTSGRLTRVALTAIQDTAIVLGTQQANEAASITAAVTPLLPSTTAPVETQQPEQAGTPISVTESVTPTENDQIAPTSMTLFPTRTLYVSATPTRAPTIVDTPLSGPPQTLAFSADDNDDGVLDLLTIQTDGSNRNVISQSPSEALLCSWSPDRQWLLFESPRGDPAVRQLYQVYLDGSGEALLPGQPQGDNSQGAVSPNGQWVAFRYLSAAKQADLFIVAIDGTRLLQVTNDAADDAEPVWAPDGNRLYFVTNRTGNYEIYYVDVSGMASPFPGPKQLTSTTGQEAYPHISPDGSTLVYDYKAVGGVWQIYSGLVKDMAKAVNLSSSGSNDTDPAWATNGNSILFVSDSGPGGRVDIYRMNPQGRSQTIVTSDTIVEHRPLMEPLPK